MENIDHVTHGRIERTRLLLRGVEVAEVLGISRALAYRWMQNGTLPTIRIDRSVRVPAEGLRAWIDRNTQNNPKQQANHERSDGDR